MSIMLFVILLHLLVARAINTRVESPPRLVLLTGRRYLQTRNSQIQNSNPGPQRSLQTRNSQIPNSNPGPQRSLQTCRYLGKFPNS